MPAASPELQSAQALIAAGRWREARPLLEALAAAADPDPRVVRLLAEMDIAEGQAQRALERLAAAIEAGDAEAALLAARADTALGHYDAAIVRLQSVVAAQPSHTQALRNLGALLAARGRTVEAREAFAQATRVAPGDAAAWLGLARVHSLLNDGAGAIDCANRARDCAPARADIWREIGLVHAEYSRWEDAAQALDRAAELDPGAPAIETLRAQVKQEAGDAQGAIAAADAAARRDPSNLEAALTRRLALKQVYDDTEDVTRWRERYADGLAAIVSGVERWLPRAADVFQLNRNNFLLAYQGEDDRELQRAYSGFIARLAGHARPQWRVPRPRRFDGGRRLRVGFVSQIFRDCTAGRYFERWVTGLDARRFERFVYHTSAIVDDFTRRIAAGSEHFAAVRAGVTDIAARLVADELDVIVYPEVGMTPMSYTLAALRLAPVQCAGWGHPVTTGSDAIDLYLSCAAMEPPDGAEHYVERLVGLPEIGVDYGMPPGAPPAARRDFGLPEDRRLYVCAQSLFKLHPEMDALFADLVAADGDAVLAFFQAPVRAVTQQFAARLQRALAARDVPPRGQVKFLPRMSGDGFRRLLALADVVLDTARFSGGNTSLDAFAAGTPVIALPGRFMRGRQTAAMLRMMGLERLVASDGADYVRLAREVAGDRALNAGLREAIAEARGALFHRPEPIAALEETLLRAASES